MNATPLSQNPFAVLIPCFNAERNIGGVLDEVLRFSENIIVVDDGSRDGSASVVERYPGVILLRHEVNRKKGAALRTGMNHARKTGYPYVITLDADGQHDPADIPAFLEAQAENPCHVLIGSRFGKGRKDTEEMPRNRYLANRISSGIISRIVGVRLEDLQCGYRLYDTTLPEKLSLEEDGFSFETEIVVKAARAGFRIGNVPVRCIYPRGTEESHYRVFSDSWRIARAVARARWGRNISS